MKLIRWLPPAVALLVVAFSIGNQRRNLAALESNNATLRQQIAAARMGGVAGVASPAKPALAAKNPKERGKLNWKLIAGQLAEMQRSRGMSEMRANIRLQQRIQAMTRDELVAALDEIATLDLPVAARLMLEFMLIGPLVQQDPELALARFSDRLQDERGAIPGQLGNAFREWAKQNPAKANAWLDRQIAAGKFDSKSLDGKSRSRIQFESVAVGNLLGVDPAAAASRLTAMPGDQRAEILRQAFSSLKEADQSAYAKLVRAQMPATEQSGLFSQQAIGLAQGRYENVSGYLARIEATPADRSACVEATAGTVILRPGGPTATREDFDALRTWVGSQAPELTDQVTGEVLGNAAHPGNGKLTFAEAAALAVQYSQAGGTDEVLGSFLESSVAREHKEQVRVLAEKITDGKRRAAILKNLE